MMSDVETKVDDSAYFEPKKVEVQCQCESNSEDMELGDKDRAYDSMERAFINQAE